MGGKTSDKQAMKISISKIKPNPANPRIIKDDKFQQLVKSLQDFPEMLDKRPLVCVTDEDGKIYPLGGNMRLKAAIQIGMNELPVTMADEWTDEQRREFIIKDNVSFGEWDFEALADWDATDLSDWGLSVPEFEAGLTDEEMDAFFKTDDSEPKEGMQKIILEYTDEDFEKVKTGLLLHGKTHEQAVYKLLGL